MSHRRFYRLRNVWLRRRYKRAYLLARRRETALMPTTTERTTDEFGGTVL